MKKRNQVTTRRQALAILLGAWPLARVRGADQTAPLRLTISESLVSGVNINDARAAMQVWLNQISVDLKLPFDINPRVFDTTEEIVRRAHTGGFDAVALTIVEYRQIVEFLDPTQIIAEGGAAGQVEYLLLGKKSNTPKLADLRGKRLTVLENTHMCIARPWLSVVLGEARLGPSDLFFTSITGDSKPSRVILPVFFGQADACLTSRVSFDTMCELNPQLGKELAILADSEQLVAAFYAFHRDYHGVARAKLAGLFMQAPRTPAERQVSTLFQFQQLVPRDARFLAPTLAMLDAADRVHREHAAGGRK